MRNFTTRIQNKANALALRARMALSNQRGDFYISDAVKIIIAVVLGVWAVAFGALRLITGGDRSVGFHGRSPLF